MTSLKKMLRKAEGNALQVVFEDGTFMPFLEWHNLQNPPKGKPEDIPWGTKHPYPEEVPPLHTDVLVAVGERRYIDFMGHPIDSTQDTFINHGATVDWWTELP